MLPFALLLLATSGYAFNAPVSPIASRSSAIYSTSLGRAGAGRVWVQGEGSIAPPFSARALRRSLPLSLSLRSAAVTEFEEKELLKGAIHPEKCPECFAELPKNVRARFCQNCRAEFVPSQIAHWNYKEARGKQFRNADLELPSSCGVCSVLSALAMLGKITKGTPEADELVAHMTPLIRKRACDLAGSNCRHETLSFDSECDVSLSEHLVGRSECGSSGSAALIDKVEEYFPDVVGAALPIGTQLPMEKDSVLEWVAGWIKDEGAVCVTYNRQNAYDGDETAIPDCWHAQTVFSVDLEERTASLTNPMKVMTEEDLVRFLPSEPILKVRANEALFHARRMTDEDIKGIVWPNERWTEMQVTEQLISLRATYSGVDDWVTAGDEFVTIPYAGTGEGVGPCFRVFAKRDSVAGQRILSAREKGEALVAEQEIEKQVDEELARVEAAAKAKAEEAAERKNAAAAKAAAAEQEVALELTEVEKAAMIKEVAEAEKERLSRLRDQVRRDVKEAEELMRSRSVEGRAQIQEEIAEAAAEDLRLADQIKLVEESEKERLQEIREKVRNDVLEGAKRQAEREAEAKAKTAAEEEQLAEEERIRAYEIAEKERLQALREKVAMDALEGEEMLKKQEEEALAAEVAREKEERQKKEEAAAIAREERLRAEEEKKKEAEMAKIREERRERAKGRYADMRIHKEIAEVELKELTGSRMLEPGLQDSVQEAVEDKTVEEKAVVAEPKSQVADKVADEVTVKAAGKTLDQKIADMEDAIVEESKQELSSSWRYDHLKREVQELAKEEMRERQDNEYKVPHEEWLRRLAEDRERKLRQEREMVEHDEFMAIYKEEATIREDERRKAKRIAMKKFKEELYKVKLAEEKRQFHDRLRAKQQEQEHAAEGQ